MRGFSWDIPILMCADVFFGALSEPAFWGLRVLGCKGFRVKGFKGSGVRGSSLKV